uniref:6-pyruvoyl tetrahydrobiopterin synthase n=1 Tax=Panagrolaimus sp. JU765 TaxID=591449 RepID=A0AC34RN63_9BILA
MGKRGRLSNIWEHFIVDDQKMICRHCDVVMNYILCANAKKHLHSCNPEAYAEVEAIDKINSIVKKKPRPSEPQSEASFQWDSEISSSDIAAQMDHLSKVFALPRASQERMMNSNSPVVELTRMETFSASHRLHSDELSEKLNSETFGKCNNANGHGHNYKWEVHLRGTVDTVTGMVYNMANLKREMAAVLELVDHKNLDLDVDYFRAGKIVSTTENVAVFLYEALKDRMELPELLYKVVVHETDKNSFTYRGQRSLFED